MDLRAINRWLERDDLSIDRCYEFILSKMLNRSHYGRWPPHWLVIRHCKNENETLQAVDGHLKGYSHMESGYVLAAAETYFFSPRIMKKGKGVTIFYF
jgi:hypothetical protein